MFESNNEKINKLIIDNSYLKKEHNLKIIKRTLICNYIMFASLIIMLITMFLYCYLYFAKINNLAFLISLIVTTILVFIAWIFVGLEKKKIINMELGKITAVKELDFDKIYKIYGSEYSVDLNVSDEYIFNERVLTTIQTLKFNDSNLSVLFDHIKLNKRTKVYNMFHVYSKEKQSNLNVEYVTIFPRPDYREVLIDNDETHDFKSLYRLQTNIDENIWTHFNDNLFLELEKYFDNRFEYFPTIKITKSKIEFIVDKGLEVDQINRHCFNYINVFGLDEFSDKINNKVVETINEINNYHKKLEEIFMNNI